MHLYQRSIKFLFLAALFFLATFAEASFKSVEDDTFNPEIGMGTDEHLYWSSGNRTS